MKILLVHQYFKTPEEGGGIRSYYLATALAKRGDHVQVLTAHDGTNEDKELEGFKVRYFDIPYANHFSFFRRLVAFGKFVLACRRYLRSNHDYDLVYVLTTPLTTGFIGSYAKRKFKLRWAFEIGDLWPEAPIQMGIIRNPVLIKWLYTLEQKFYKRADRLIGLSPSIRDYVEYTTDFEETADIFPNVADCKFFNTADVKGAFSAENPFRISYIGAVGMANHLEFLINLVKLANEAQLHVHFHIMGEGKRLAAIKALAENLTNLTFHAAASKESVKHLLDKSHALYVSFKDVDILGTGSPNKLFDGLAAGKLIIINFRGWIKKLIEEQECGFYYPPREPAKAIEILKNFLNSPELLQEYQNNARQLAEKQYCRELVMNNLSQLLEDQFSA
ncbi:MAG: glycosyltransferase family 4 protein [Cyclobacteriaceae bacterium]|nr:glycosyltransferase family 4 protein [Cyclobacteriaceae bacterium HetDA_MAG_MS6]